MSINNAITITLFDVVEDAAILPIGYPNVDHNESPTYIEVDLIPAGVDTQLRLDVYQGIFQITIIDVQGIGLPPLMAYADQFINLFPRQSTITDNGVTIIFEKPGEVAPGIIRNGNYHLPISINYKVLN